MPAAVKAEVVKMSPQCKGLEVLSFDLHNQKSVDRVVRQAKVSAERSVCRGRGPAGH